VIPEGAFEDDVHRLLGHAGRGAAHDAGDALGARVVGDHDGALGEGVSLFVERLERLAARGAMDAQIARDAGRVEDVQRAVAVEGEEVRHVHERRDRAQPDGAQPVLQPLRRGAVAHAPDHARREDRAAVARVRVDRHAHRAREGAGDRRALDRLQRAEAARGEIAGDAAHAERVGPVGGDRDLDHRVHLGRVMRSEPVDETLAHLAGGQLDDAVVLLRKLHLALGAHHAVALDAADLAHLDRGVDAGDIGAGMRDHRGDARAGVRRAADDLRLAPVGLDAADAEAVGVGVLFGLEHLAQREAGEPRGGVVHLLHLEAEIGQRLGDLGHARGRVEMILEPGEGEFHGAVLRASGTRGR
jgi:hypothetical protein